MEKWRLLKLGEVDALTSSILFEALETAKNRGVICNTLALHRSLPCVVMGEQGSFSHINLSSCKEMGIPIVRTLVRGLIYLWGDLCSCTLVLDKDSFHSVDTTIPWNLFIKSLVKSYKILGIPANHRPASNDILVGERKITGMAIRCSKKTLFLASHISLDFNYDLADKVLIIPAKKFEDKKAKSVGEWVTSAKRELNREVSFEEAQVALIRGFGEVLQVEFDVVDSLSEAEKQIIEELKEKYQSEEWIEHGRWSPVKDYWR